MNEIRDDVGRCRLPLREGLGRMHSQRPVSCDAGDATTVAWGPISQGPILSMTSPATASCVHRDRGSSFYATYEWSPVASVPGLWRRLPSVPGLRSLYEVQRVRPQSGDRALRRRAAPSSCLDVYQRGQGSVQAEKAVGRTGLRNHQRATGGTEVPAARHGQRVGRVDSVGDCLQPAHPLAGVVPLHLR